MKSALEIIPCLLMLRAEPLRVNRRPARPRPILGVQCALEQELEERIVTGEGSCGRICLVDRLPDRLSVDAFRTSGYREFIVDLWIGERVQGETAIAKEVVDFRRLVANEDIEPVVCHDGTDRVDAGTPI